MVPLLLKKIKRRKSISITYNKHVKKDGILMALKELINSQAILEDTIPLLHPATIRINALSSSRSRGGIIYHLR
jgi:hypothetical protein